MSSRQRPPGIHLLLNNVGLLLLASREGLLGNEANRDLRGVLVTRYWEGLNYNLACVK